MADDARGYTHPFGPEIQVMLGVSQEEYERLRRSPAGVDVSKDPEWHSHPFLGITGHLHHHGSQLHGHIPRVIWEDVVLLADEDEALARKFGEGTKNEEPKKEENERETEVRPATSSQGRWRSPNAIDRHPRELGEPT